MSLLKSRFPTFSNRDNLYAKFTGESLTLLTWLNWPPFPTMSNSGDENGFDLRSIFAHQFCFCVDSSTMLWFNTLHWDIVEGLGNELAILVKCNC